MSPAHSGIQALVDLARRDGVEMRPVLLRVLTDLYVQEPTHGPAERARFSELVCRLLDKAEPATRAAVAERLASYPGTPSAIAEKLARDEFAVAAPILRRSAALDETAMHMVLNFCSPAHAGALAERPNLPPRIARRLREAQQWDAGRTIPESPEPAVDAGTTYALARRYLAAKSHERLTIFSAIGCCPAVEHEKTLYRIDRSLHERLERAALRHRTAEFVVHVRDATGMAQDIAQRIVADSSGEPLAVLCRAVDMPFSLASRILLFLNPAVGGSVQQVFGMASRYVEMSAVSARRLAGAWCGLGEGLLPQRSPWTRTERERIDSRPAIQRSIRCTTPARPAAANES